MPWYGVPLLWVMVTAEKACLLIERVAGRELFERELPPTCRVCGRPWWPDEDRLCGDCYTKGNPDGS